MCPLAVAILFGRYLLTSCTVSPGHDLKYPIWIHLIHVDLTWLNDAGVSISKHMSDFSCGMHCLFLLWEFANFFDWCVFFPMIIYIVLLLLPLLLLGFVTYFV